MTNGEKFKEVFGTLQVDEGDFHAYAWLPNHDAIEIPLEWWDAEYKESKTGYWLEITNNRGTVIALRCSCCGKSPKHAIKSDFCPNCGKRMVDPRENEG